MPQVVSFGAHIADALGWPFTAVPDGQHLAMLEKMSQVAAAAHAPFLTAPSAQMFGLQSFGQLGEPRDVSKIFDSVDYAKWKSFPESDDARYVGMCMPHILMRLPYGEDTVPVETFNFREDVDGRDASKYLWGNAAYALAARITNAFAQYAWCVAIRGCLLPPRTSPGRRCSWRTGCTRW